MSYEEIIISFVTIAFDPSYIGESGGEPRYVSSPDINTEDFSAAVDYLSLQDNVDPERIGIIGVCGWGGIALNAAAIDPRIKATVATTMYGWRNSSLSIFINQQDARTAIQNVAACPLWHSFKAGTGW